MASPWGPPCELMGRNMRQAIETIVTTTSDLPPHTGLIVGTLEGGRRSVFGYGSLDGGSPAGDTVFEIGSVSKVFTTALLSILVADEVVSLDQPAAELSPGLAEFPRQITLLHLATHTSGLPKMPSNTLRSMLRNRGNPYANYTSTDLFRYLAGHPPAERRIRAGQVAYSNLGMGLLGTLLARKVGQTYEAAIDGRICAPLRMKDTVIRLTPDPQRRMAAPHRARGKHGQTWDMPAFEGAGGLKSTADDLLTFLAANLGAAPSSLAAALQACHQVRTRAFAPPGLLQRLTAPWTSQGPEEDPTHEGMALGWTVGRRSSGAAEVHWHHGATGGYRAFVGFVRPMRVAAVVLANTGPSLRDGLSGTTATDRLGFEILEHLVSGEGPWNLSST